MPNTYSTRPITPTFATPQSALESSRLIPYAKDHDRLQLALLYIESNASQLKDISDLELRMLNSRKESLEKEFKDRNLNKEKEAEKYLRTHHPANYTDISGNKAFPGISTHSHIFRPSTPSPDPNDRQFKAARDEKLKTMFREERLDEQEYAAVMARLGYINDLRTKVKEGVEQKREILKLIEELYATAFDGVTPEFPHEDELEGLVAIAEASLRGEEQALEGISRETELNKLVTPAEDAHNMMNTIREHAVRLFDMIRMQRPYDTQAFFTKEMASIRLDDQCHSAASWCDKLREDLNTYLAKTPKSAFRQTIKNALGEVPELIPVFTGAQLVNKLNEAGKGGAPAQLLLAVLVHLIKKLANIVNALTQAFKIIERKVMAGKQAVQTAKIVLDLRRRQLAAARCHILDHVVDPEKCPLEQRADKLPEYPEDISTFSIGGGHPRARQLLQQAERYEPEEYVDDIVRSRLNRARRTTHPPILSAERYQPPGYDEPEDAKHSSRITPPKGGPTPAYTEEPDYGEHVRTDRAHIKFVVLDGELGTVVRNARAGLFPTQPAFDSWVQELLNSAQASGLQIFTISPSRRRL